MMLSMIMTKSESKQELGRLKYLARSTVPSKPHTIEIYALENITFNI